MSETPFHDVYRDKLKGDKTDIRFHLPYLYETTVGYKEPNILECGVRDGNSTAAFMAGIEKVGGHLKSIDVKPFGIEGKVAAAYMDSKQWEVGVFNDLALFIDKGFDIVFIDTSHHLYHTLSELRKFYRWVNPGGRMLFHDTEWTGIDVYDSDCMLGENGGFGPVAWALDMFCEEFKTSWMNHPGSFGLGEIYVEGLH